MRRSLLLMMAGGLAAAAAFASAALWYSRPTTLHIAVTRDGDDARLVYAIAQTFAKEHASVRLKPLLVNDGSASAAALEAETADLAVVRTDVRLPPNGQTLAVLHRNPAIILTTRAAEVTRLADLRGHPVGVVRGPNTAMGNLRLFESILTQYELSTKDVPLVDIARDQVFDALSTGRVSAVMVVGALNSQTVQDVVAAVSLVGKGEPVFLPVSEAKAMAQRSPVVEAIEVVRGAFGGAPPKPAEPFETIGVSVHLMADNGMKDHLASEITKMLFSHRPSIAQIAPLANQIEAPSTAKGAAIPVHPGAAAYLDDEEKTFFDNYSDAIYIGAMLLSVVGSAAAALASRFGTSGRARMDGLLERLLSIVREARTAETLAVLDDLEASVDSILAEAVSARARLNDGGATAALTLALDQARLAIADRRRALSAGFRVVSMDAPRSLTAG